MSRITDILEASSLSDGEIQRLIELLLEKSNANEEWEGVSRGGSVGRNYCFCVFVVCLFVGCTRVDCCVSLY